MNFELISAEEFENLSEDDEQCFVEFEAICRRNMNQILEDEKSGDFFVLVRGQYMTAIYSVAKECGITGLPDPWGSDDYRENYDLYSRFALAVQGEARNPHTRTPVTQRSLGAVDGEHAPQDRALRFPPAKHNRQIGPTGSAKKGAAQQELDELVDEVGKPRLNLGKTMLILSMVLVGLENVTTIAAEGPAAITHIMQLIGVDKETEDAAVSRLVPPPKALPAPSQKPQTDRGNAREAPAQVRVTDLEDGIPF